MKTRSLPSTGILIFALSSCGVMAQTLTPTPIPEDINKNGVVDHIDLLQLQAKWHFTSEPTRSPTPSSTPTVTRTPTQTRTPVIGDLVVDLPGGTQMAFMMIPAGSVMMGSTDGPDWSWCHEDNDWPCSCEQPVHEVNIGYNFYMGKTEVTQAQWIAIMGSVPGLRECGVGDNYPLYDATWDECQDFLSTLNNFGQGTFRLPSEAEWEYACRAGTTRRFYFGDSTCLPRYEDCELDNYAWWYANDDSNETKQVGGKLPNAFGLFDMYGNVAEWCQDHWYATYIGAPTDGSAWESSPPATLPRVIRGGHWESPARQCRSSSRQGYNGGGCLFGLRVVRDAE